MNLFRSFAPTVLIAVLLLASCSTDAVRPSSSAGALTANAALENLPPRPFGRHVLTVSGLHSMNEFIRPEVRSRMDEEPVGDADSGYDASTLDTASPADQPASGIDDDRAEDPAQNAPADEDTMPAASSDVSRFLWAKKSFGDAIKANPANNGVIVLYADEEHFDLNALMTFIEDGRSRIAKKSDIEGDRIQVVFGGYRGVPQVELWVVQDGSPMPELKPEDRAKATGHQN
jgi:hypothetical protein